MVPHLCAVIRFYMVTDYLLKISINKSRGRGSIAVEIGESAIHRDIVWVCMRELKEDVKIMTNDLLNP